jgi:hypothetical protein
LNNTTTTSRADNFDMRSDRIEWRTNCPPVTAGAVALDADQLKNQRVSA